MKSTAVLGTPASPLASAPQRQAFLPLRTVFTVAPVIFGLLVGALALNRLSPAKGR